MSDFSPDPTLTRRLAEESRNFDATAADAERNCWMVVHRHVHGVLPSEYDIREIPEDLFLAVLACRKAESRCAAGDQASDATATELQGNPSNRQEMR